MNKTPCTIMRGGTSKAVFFKYEDMPKDKTNWSDFLLDVMGSPDARQIDGLGGANSLTSKVAIIKKSDNEDYDIEYTFAQVSLTERMVDFKGNCGNISSAVGPFAINEGLVDATNSKIEVKILNTNTNKLIISEVEIENGQAKVSGDTNIPGVPNPGSPIYLAFYNSEGAVTGKLLPTGNVIDTIKTSIGKIDISIVDAANPLVFMNAKDIGLKGTELPDELTEGNLKLIEEIRSIAAEMCGFASKEEATKKSPAVPKATVISAPAEYVDLSGNKRNKEDMDVVVRMMSMQKPHRAIAITGAVCITTAANIEGTLVNKLVKDNSSKVKIAHPGGIMETVAIVKNTKVECVKVVRTARRIMEGYVYTR
ncbi:2-methylaconitate cis-trans isomerase PrpF family protein [Clostridium estertheticum]|uniref:2-methylaconitate cis-trans isomerase PrpF family protein n=1 Tax=Clostridium estertheticum TaxID=238834 RepID=UPI001C7D6E46|nr:PrpF domain-containing protein [Clostridium estertheticum]MBX4265074.1 3-methylitaconate isomerase [Clostridium estertheticum]MBX4268536.1 3-methylitaconate isomerase [Clostridium estertheticum]WLC81404.1 3-methylitaconate isomerase [Clostridium estertheticum]WLC88537.1 3-methylitaconate isomerase [Clostridium estertheticum]